MSAPQPGETILIRRPGFPDIRMRFEREDPLYRKLARDGWLWLQGEVLEGLQTGAGHSWRTLYARPVGPGVWTMVGNPK